MQSFISDWRSSVVKDVSSVCHKYSNVIVYLKYRNKNVGDNGNSCSAVVTHWRTDNICKKPLLELLLVDGWLDRSCSAQFSLVLPWGLLKPPGWYRQRYAYERDFRLVGAVGDFRLHVMSSCFSGKDETCMTASVRVFRSKHSLCLEVNSSSA